jgi:tetratricopeptide (TPR) repeat protein
MQTTVNTTLKTFIAAALLSLLSACSIFVEKASEQLGNDLRGAILDHDDPQTVADAMPAWLILLDAMLRSNPESEGLLTSAANMYGAYAGLFVEDDHQRALRLTQRALDYSRRATCLSDAEFCAVLDAPYLDFEAAMASLEAEQIDTIYALATSWTGWIKTRRDDFAAISDLPKVESLLRWVVDQDASHDAGGPFLYLAVLNSQRPAAVGGDLDGARAFYEQALDLSEQQNLLVKVYYASEYGRMVFDRELHDRLLNEVIDAKANVPGYTLSNQLAKARAQDLLEEADEYF